MDHLISLKQGISLPFEEISALKINYPWNFVCFYSQKTVL